MIANILIIEDEVNLQQSLRDYLTGEGFAVTTVSLLKDATVSFDLILLDWMLPDGQGIDLLKSWRQTGLKTPVILLTAKSDLIDKVLGLELGANDYITKPFAPRELLARIHVQLRQTRDVRHNSDVELSGIKIVFASREVYYHHQKIDLTKTEYDLLKFLMQNPNQVFSREELLKNVWGYERFPTTRTVDTHILQLRQKIAADLFETMHGIGYRFKEKNNNHFTGT